MTKNTKRTI